MKIEDSAPDEGIEKRRRRKEKKRSEDKRRRLQTKCQIKRKKEK